MLADQGRVAFDGGTMDDPALSVEDTKRGLLHRDVETNEVLLGHNGALLPDRATIMRRHRRETRPEYPI
jgi:hypothetical protein